MTTGERIKILREKVGITQEEFSQRLGTTRNTITNYEANRRMPMDATIKSICREFNVSETWLRTGEGEMFAPEPAFDLGEYANRHGMTALETEILKAYLELDPNTRESLLQHFKERLTNSAPAVDAEIETTTPVPDIGKDIHVPATSPDLTAKFAELERQNQKLATEIAATKEDDAGMEAATELSAWPSVSAGNLNPVERTKK